MDRTGDAALTALDALGAATDASGSPDDVAAVLAYAEELADRPAESGASRGVLLRLIASLKQRAFGPANAAWKNRITASGRLPWALDAA